jgi:hypothetical protein
LNQEKKEGCTGGCAQRQNYVLASSWAILHATAGSGQFLSAVLGALFSDRRWLAAPKPGSAPKQTGVREQFLLMQITSGSKLPKTGVREQFLLMQITSGSRRFTVKVGGMTQQRYDQAEYKDC